MNLLNAQFEVAHVVYQEQPVVLYYLDHDPVLCARWLCDWHLPAALTSAVAMLTNAWHAVNPAYLPLEQPGKYGHLFARRAPVSGPEWGTLQQKNKDAFYEEFGSEFYWVALGQRIKPPFHPDHPNCAWAGAAGGNYRWVVAHAWALVEEAKYRFNRTPAELPYLFTLEAEPPQLWQDEEATEPPPAVPPECAVTVDGYFDTPASYKEYYAAKKQPILKWTRRAPPPWLVWSETERRFNLTVT